MSGTDRHSVLIDLDKKERGGTRLWQRIVLIGIGTALAAAALLAQQRGDSEPEPAPTATPTPTGALLDPRTRFASLVLPTGLADVELSAFPDWLANEALPASFRAAIAIRGTVGIASVEGPTVVNWTEAGVSYRLESLQRTVPELVILADSLR
jgi:hypothetical protein